MVIAWPLFIVGIGLLLALDLLVLHRRARAESVKAALLWSAVWVGLGLAFGVAVYLGYEYHWLGLGRGIDAIDGQVNDGRSAVIKYLTGYVLEKSLSADNLVVMALLFDFFAIPRIYQHRVLFYGIIGAVALRGVMIVLGVELLDHFHWVLYVFGAFLVVAALRMLRTRAHEADFERHLFVRLVRRLSPIVSESHGGRFVVRLPAAESACAGADRNVAPDRHAAARAGRWMLTPLALALVVVEASDLVFAVDSIPAVLGVTADPFLVFTSNVFAILGLRSLYFALAGMMARFGHLRASLAVVLALVGVKMLAGVWIEAVLGPWTTPCLLVAVLLILAAGVAWSVRRAGDVTGPAQPQCTGAPNAGP